MDVIQRVVRAETEFHFRGQSKLIANFGFAANKVSYARCKTGDNFRKKLQVEEC